MALLLLVGELSSWSQPDSTEFLYRIGWFKVSKEKDLETARYTWDSNYEGSIIYSISYSVLGTDDLCGGPFCGPFGAGPWDLVGSHGFLCMKTM